MSVLGSVLAQARLGRGARRIAEELGVDVGLVEAGLDHWERAGAITRSGLLLGCAGCGVREPAAPGTVADAEVSGQGGVAAPSCRGCPFAH